MSKKISAIMYIQKSLLMTIARELMGLSDSDLADIFNMTRQNVHKTLGPNKLPKGQVSEKVKEFFN